VTWRGLFFGVATTGLLESVMQEIASYYGCEVQVGCEGGVEWGSCY
jgi:hypothetical protein